jgi:hypothetical protein
MYTRHDPRNGWRDHVECSPFCVLEQYSDVELSGECLQRRGRVADQWSDGEELATLHSRIYFVRSFSAVVLHVAHGTLMVFERVLLFELRYVGLGGMLLALLQIL